MRQHHWSQGLFLVGMALLTAVIIPACGSGSGAASPSFTSALSNNKVHDSTVGGVVAVPIGSGLPGFVVRSIAFTPTATSDVLVYVGVGGTYTGTAGQMAIFLQVIDDATGLPICTSTSLVANVGTNIPYRIVQPLSINAFTTASFPSASYTIRLMATSSGVWAGNVNSSAFRVITLENVTVDSPSANIIG
jgi:vacuolar-type H+-ATPase catalytic subunit A/Vma1